MLKARRLVSARPGATPSRHQRSGCPLRGSKTPRPLGVGNTTRGVRSKIVIPGPPPLPDGLTQIGLRHEKVVRAWVIDYGVIHFPAYSGAAVNCGNPPASIFLHRIPNIFALVHSGNVDSCRKVAKTARGGPRPLPGPGFTNLFLPLAATRLLQGSCGRVPMG